MDIERIKLYLNELNNKIEDLKTSKIESEMIIKNSSDLIGKAMEILKTATDKNLKLNEKIDNLSSFCIKLKEKIDFDQSEEIDTESKQKSDENDHQLKNRHKRNKELDGLSKRNETEKYILADNGREEIYLREKNYQDIPKDYNQRQNNLNSQGNQTFKYGDSLQSQIPFIENDKNNKFQNVDQYFNINNLNKMNDHRYNYSCYQRKEDDFNNLKNSRNEIELNKNYEKIQRKIKDENIDIRDGKNLNLTSSTHNKISQKNEEYIFYWQSNENPWKSGQKDEWTKYQKVDQIHLEINYQEYLMDIYDKSKKFCVLKSNKDYYVDFESKVQISTKDGTKQRKIKREVLSYISDVRKDRFQEIEG